MTTWLVDCGPLSVLAKCGQRHGWSPPAHILHISDWVRHELQGKPGVGDAPNPTNQWILDRGVEVHPLVVGTPVWRLSQELSRSPRGGDANRGEHELIALAAAVLPEAVFVSQD